MGGGEELERSKDVIKIMQEKDRNTEGEFF